MTTDDTTRLEELLEARNHLQIMLDELEQLNIMDDEELDTVLGEDDSEALLSHDVSGQPRDEDGRWTKVGKEEWNYSDKLPPHTSWQSQTTKDGYVYHATNRERVGDIQSSVMRSHRPWYGTQQNEWPDKSTAKRIYLSETPADAWKFAPEDGEPALLRIKRHKSFKTEGTGDLYLEGKKIPPHRLEVLTEDGWKKLKKKINVSSLPGKGKKKKQHVPNTQFTDPRRQDRIKIAGTAKDAGMVQREVMGRPEKMVKLKVRGHTVMWGEESEVDAVEFCRQVLREEFRLPKVLQRATKEVIFTSQENKDDPWWRIKYADFDFSDAVACEDGSIVVFRGYGITEDMFAHECGHNLAHSVWGQFEPPAGSLYAAAQIIEPPVSDYGKNSPSEDFAEACAMYVTDGPVRMRKNFPLKTEALEILFK